jgi:hypothetical protein
MGGMVEPIEGDAIEDSARAPALIRYLAEGDYVTRRYVSRGAEINTGDYVDHATVVRDGMPIRDHFTLDRHGFMIGRHRSAIADFHDRAAVDAGYLREVEKLVARMCGADRVAAQGWMIRTSADLSARAKEKVENYQHAGGIQPRRAKRMSTTTRLPAVARRRGFTARRSPMRRPMPATSARYGARFRRGRRTGRWRYATGARCATRKPPPTRCSWSMNSRPAMR